MSFTGLLRVWVSKCVLCCVIGSKAASSDRWKVGGCNCREFSVVCLCVCMSLCVCMCWPPLKTVKGRQVEMRSSCGVCVRCLCKCVFEWRKKWFQARVIRLFWVFGVCVCWGKRLCVVGCVKALFHPTTPVQTSCQSFCPTAPDRPLYSPVIHMHAPQKNK